MTGPEHYKRAEELLASAHGHANARDDVTAALATAAAQVHATLALAAATWDVGSSVAQDEPLHRDEWSGATS